VRIYYNNRYYSQRGNVTRFEIALDPTETPNGWDNNIFIYIDINEKIVDVEYWTDRYFTYSFVKDGNGYGNFQGSPFEEYIGGDWMKNKTERVERMKARISDARILGSKLVGKTLISF